MRDFYYQGDCYQGEVLSTIVSLCVYNILVANQHMFSTFWRLLGGDAFSRENGKEAINDAFFSIENFEWLYRSKWGWNLSSCEFFAKESGRQWKKVIKKIQCCGFWNWKCEFIKKKVNRIWNLERMLFYAIYVCYVC